MKFTNRATLFGIGALIIGPWLFPSTLAALVNSWWGLPIFLLCFTAFAVGIISWGLLLERRLGGGLVAVAPFGLAACIFFAGIIGHLGGLHLAASLLFPSILLGGFILARNYWCSFLAIRSLKQLCNTSWFAVIFTLAAFIRLYAGFLPEGHGDPLYYHLLGPRLWVEAGKISVNNDLPSAVLAGAWEYLYVWPQVLWRNGGIQGLIAAQIFSQWLHLVFGWLGCSFVIYKMARLLKAEESTAKFMALAALFASSVQWTGGLAKNDLGIAFFALSSIYLMLAWARENQLRCATLASPAFLGGLAVGGKVNALFVMAPFGIIFALSIFNGGSAGRIKGLGCAKVFLALASGVVLGAIPFFLRNYYLTANPFYPLFGAYFPSEVMSQSWLDFVSMLNPNGETDRLAIALRRLRELSKENPMMWGWLLLLALPSRRFRVAIKPFWIPIATAALSFILFALAFVGHIELRHLGAGLVLLSALGALFFWEASTAFIKRENARRATRVLLVIALLANCHLPFHLLWQQARYPAGLRFLETHTAGKAKFWIRENIDPHLLIVSEVDNEMYYLPNRRMTLVTDRPDIDRATYKKTSAEEYLRGLCTSSGSFLLFDARPGDGFEKRFPDTAARMPTLYNERGAKIYDLAIAERALGWNLGCIKNKGL